MLKVRLKQCREGKKISQTKMANMLNITRQAYNHYETGTRLPTLETLILLSDFFEVSVDYLLGKTEKDYLTIANINENFAYPVLEKYKKLNSIGRQKADEYITDLLDSGKYLEEYSDEVFPYEA